jgi:hypothetical protein
MNVNDRLIRLERAAAGPNRDIFFFDGGNGLTEDEAARAAEAEARGDTVMIFGWGASSDGN